MFIFFTKWQMATKVWYSNFALYVKPNLEDVDSYLEQGDFAESEEAKV